MKKGLFDRRIPTLLALFVLVAIIGISVVLVRSGIFYVGKAAPDSQPQNFSLTNITDTSFTAVFTTTGSVDAAVSMASAGTGTTLILDDRDKKSGAQTKYFSHHITVPGLSPETEYVFKLIVNGSSYQSSEYKIKTGKQISTQPPAQNPIFGTVLLPDGALGTDSVVIVKSGESQAVSSVTDAKGEFILPTNSLRDGSHSSYVMLSENSDIELTIMRQTMSARINTLFKTAQNLPAVTLQQDYDFITRQEATPSPAAPLFNFSVPSQGQAVDITTPEDGESFTDLRPVFQGTSYPNTSINITIPKVTTQQVTAGADGSWSFQPSSPIAQGNYTITIEGTDENNEEVTVTKRFTIFALGSQIVESATPSATPANRPSSTPTRTPTPTPTLVPSVSPSTTLSPSPTAQPTPTATLIPTATLTPTVIPATPTPNGSEPTAQVTPTALPTISDPGGTENTMILTGFSIILIVAGIIMLFAL